MLVIWLDDDFHSDESRRHSASFNTVMEESRNAIANSFGHGSLLKKTIFMPMDIIMLVNQNLLNDQFESKPDIEETYSRYLKELVCNPSLKMQALIHIRNRMLSLSHCKEYTSGAFRCSGKKLPSSRTC